MDFGKQGFNLVPAVYSRNIKHDMHVPIMCHILVYFLFKFRYLLSPKDIGHVGFSCNCEHLFNLFRFDIDNIN